MCRAVTAVAVDVERGVRLVLEHQGERAHRVLEVLLGSNRETIDEPLLLPGGQRVRPGRQVDRVRHDVEVVRRAVARRDVLSLAVGEGDQPVEVADGR